MPIQVEQTRLAGVLVIIPEKYSDERGFFSETYNMRDLAAAGFAGSFVQDNHSLSMMRGTVRGLHFQAPPEAQAKLVRVTRGSILDVAVDLRKTSPTFGAHVAVELSARSWKQLLVPKGFAHGYCTIEPETEVVYKVSASYAPQSDRGILWNDPALGIAWPDFAGAELSARDAALPPLAACDNPFAEAQDWQ